MANERPEALVGGLELFDETLRDGLQSPSVTVPSLAEKRAILHAMVAVGLQAVDLGLPAAGAQQAADTRALAQEIVAQRLPLQAACAVRATVEDARVAAALVQQSACPVLAYAFLAASPVRLRVEDWTLEQVRRRLAATLDFAAREQLQVCVVIEDAVRSPAAILSGLLAQAVEGGAARLCLCDTAGGATPEETRQLVQWTRRWLNEHGGGAMGLDWHGHNDRGLAVANTLAAWSAGAQRLHGTALGLGERVGNAAMEVLLLNLHLMGVSSYELSQVHHYCAVVAEACQVAIPFHHPVVGRDAFRTGTGVHAAAVTKAQKKGCLILADQVYSAVDAALFGRRQNIVVGAFSGASNVIHWLETHGVAPHADLVERILIHAKASRRVLTDVELAAVVRDFGGGAVALMQREANCDATNKISPAII